MIEQLWDGYLFGSDDVSMEGLLMADEIRLDPMGAPCVSPERIVSVTGSRDVVTRQAWADNRLRPAKAGEALLAYYSNSIPVSA